MKHLLVVCILLTTFISCKKNTLTLSCSKEINDWANSVIAYYELAPREQIIQLPISRQRAIFRGLSSKRKVSLWNDKLSLILYDETYTEEQCADFSVLIKQLDATVFDDEVCQKAFNEYAELWETSMKDKYGWDENVLFMLAYTWMTEEEFIQSVLAESNLIVKGSGSGEIDIDDENDCNCRTDIYCKGLRYIECDKENNPCNITSGCGILGTSNCIGKCK